MLGNMSAGKGLVRAGSVRRSLNSSALYENKKCKRNCKSWIWQKMAFLMPPHPLTNFEIKRYYQINLDLMVLILETMCLKKIKDGAYVINFDEYADVETH